MIPRFTSLTLRLPRKTRGVLIKITFAESAPGIFCFYKLNAIIEEALMTGFTFLLIFIAGFVLGMATALILRLVQTKTAKGACNGTFHGSETKRKVDTEAVLENLKASFGSLSLDALSKSTEEFLKLAKAKLESEREIGEKDLDEKKALIDQQLQRMGTELEDVTHLMQDLEKDRIEKFGVLASQLKTAGEQTAALVQVTTTHSGSFGEHQSSRPVGGTDG